MKKQKYILTAVIIGAGLFLAASLNLNPNSSWPSYIRWATTAEGSTQYELASFYSNVFKKRFNVILHSLPFKSDEGSLDALQKKSVDFMMAGISGSFFAQEGLLLYAREGAGPQKLRLLLENKAPVLRTMAVQKASKIKSIKDLKGKRIAWLKKLPEVKVFMLALLKYEGLGMNDVTLVSFDDGEKAIEGLLRGEVDAVFTPSRERLLAALPQDESFPMRYISMPKDSSKWKNVEAYAPYFSSVRGTIGGGLSEKQFVVSSYYKFPVLLTLPDNDVSYVKLFVSGLLDVLPLCAGIDKKMAGWEVATLPLDWLVPFHDGAIAVFKEKGIWTQEHQAYNDRLIKRQDVLAKAWGKYLESAEKNRFNPAAWYDVREKALEKEGFASGFLQPKLYEEMMAPVPGE